MLVASIRDDVGDGKSECIRFGELKKLIAKIDI